jgi:hypothetical protein
VIQRSFERRPALLHLIILSFQLLSLNCLAQTIEIPAVKSGDTWKYRMTIEKAPNGWTQTDDEFTVSRITSTTIYFSFRQSGSTQPAQDQIAGRDWRRFQDVNGSETVINQPLSFPLATGKSWDIEYTEQHPNKAHKFERWQSTFRVIGSETVEVPAGKFNALKIEAEGHWTAEAEPSQSVVQGAQSAESGTTMVTEVKKTTVGPVTGRTYKAFWYAPEVKRWVKSVEEYYGNGGVRNERYTAELESYKVAD